MATEADTTTDALSPEGLEALLRLLATGHRRRIRSANVGGRTVWIKSFGAPNRSTGKWLHALASPLLPVAFLRASPRVDAIGQAEREVRKTSAFRQAGFPALDVLYRNGDVLVFGNVGHIVHDDIRRMAASDPAGADALLIACAEALGRAHAAGLVHGRPHPRDMFADGGRIGFLDFEEEPEASMPLAKAQARDTWLLFQQITMWAKVPDTAGRALAAYRRHAPAAAIAELREMVGFFTRLLGVSSLFRRLLGRDAQRAVTSTLFLKSALTQAPSRVAGQLQEDVNE
jgi:tRNA A-37 threonylcarbamoyl transferase component Bud32